MTAKRALIIGEVDNVATALEDVNANEMIAARGGNMDLEVKALDDVPFGFKVAIKDIAKGAEVYKYGEVIGRASEDIKLGNMVHVHNVEGTRGRGDLANQGGQK